MLSMCWASTFLSFFCSICPIKDEEQIHSLNVPPVKGRTKSTETKVMFRPNIFLVPFTDRNDMADLEVDKIKELRSIATQKILEDITFAEECLPNPENIYLAYIDSKGTDLDFKWVESHLTSYQYMEIINGAPLLVGVIVATPLKNEVPTLGVCCSISKDDPTNIHVIKGCKFFIKNAIREFLYDILREIKYFNNSTELIHSMGTLRNSNPDLITVWAEWYNLLPFIDSEGELLPFVASGNDLLDCYRHGCYLSLVRLYNHRQSGEFFNFLMKKATKKYIDIKQV